MQRARRAASAGDQFASPRPVRELARRAEHPGTLTIRANLAYWTERADKGRQGVMARCVR